MTAFELRNTTALVTGGAKRLGREVALALAARGADVLVHFGTSADEAARTCRDLERLGVRAWAVQADLAVPEACDALAQECLRLAGPVHVLISSASSFTPGSLQDLSLPALTRDLQLHALAPLQLARAFVAALPAGQGGRVVNLLDSYVTRFQRRFVGYNLSKRALLALTEMMALEFAPAVTVNAVAPGLILPPPGGDLEAFERLKAANPLQRQGTAADIVQAVLYLLEAQFVTGQVIFVDGGAALKARA